MRSDGVRLKQYGIGAIVFSREEALMRFAMTSRTEAGAEHQMLEIHTGILEFILKSSAE